jgi:hypothetical protein
VLLVYPASAQRRAPHFFFLCPAPNRAQLLCHCCRRASSDATPFQRHPRSSELLSECATSPLSHPPRAIAVPGNPSMAFRSFPIAVVFLAQVNEAGVSLSFVKLGAHPVGFRQLQQAPDATGDPRVRPSIAGLRPTTPSPSKPHR